MRHPGHPTPTFRTRHAGRRLLSVALLAGFASACNWVSLAKNAFTYDTIRRGEAGNLAALDTLIYATTAEDGLVIVGAPSGRVLATVPPAAGTESADDLAIADGLLFVLDARPPGHLSVYLLTDPLHPRLVAPPRDVPVGPFSGVSANGGLCVVSGGTSQLTAWGYDSTGGLSGPVATADLGRGQPDVLVARDGRLAYVATHYRGPDFGLDVVRYDPAAGRLQKLAELELDGAGFTEGGAKPANFPIQAAILGDDTLLVAYRRGVAVIAIGVPRRPAVLERIDVGGPAVHIAVMGTAAVVAVAGARPALVMLDFSSSPVGITRRALAAGTSPAGVILTPAYAALAARDRGVLVFAR